MSRIIMIAVADLMLCIAAQAMLLYEDDYVAREAAYARREAAIQTERIELDAERRRVEREIKKEKAEAVQDLTKVRAAVALTRDETQRLIGKRWEIVTSRYFLHKKDYNPDLEKKEFGRLYCMTHGIFTGPSTQAMSDEDVLVWTAGLDAGIEEVVLFVENGANDQYLRGRSLLQQSERLKYYTFVVLPSELKFRIDR